jgi:hypothetical protein
MRWDTFQKDRFLGKVLNEWIAYSQEFVHTKLPRRIASPLSLLYSAACCE